MKCKVYFLSRRCSGGVKYVKGKKWYKNVDFYSKCIAILLENLNSLKLSQGIQVSELRTWERLCWIGKFGAVL